MAVSPLYNSKISDITKPRPSTLRDMTIAMSALILRNSNMFRNNVNQFALHYATNDISYGPTATAQIKNVRVCPTDTAQLKNKQV